MHDHGTDPIKSDSDQDGFNDGIEIGWHCDPLNPVDNPVTRILEFLIPTVMFIIIFMKFQNSRKRTFQKNSKEKKKQV